MARVINERYELGPQRGAGPVGIVFGATDRHTGQAVAVKVLSPAAAQNAALREAFFAPTAAEHAVLLPTLDAGQVGKYPYRVTPFVAGPNLAEWLARQTRPLPPQQASAFVAQIAGALGRGQPHGNLKPTNILLEGGRVRLSDAGLPSPPGPYTAPEVAAGGPVTPRADVYSLGVILGEAWQQVRLPSAVRDVLARATQPDPATRYATLGAFSAALRTALTEPEPSPQVPAKQAQVERRPSRGTLVLAAAILPLAIIGIIVAALALRSTPAETAAVPTLAGLPSPLAIVDAGATANARVTPSPTRDPNESRPTLPPTWTATASPTLTSTPTATEATGPTAWPTLSQEQLAGTYWDGDGYDSMWELELPDGSYPRFSIFPVNLWVGSYGNVRMTADHEAGIQNAIQEISQVVPMTRVSNRLFAHVTIWLMTDAEFNQNAACSYVDLTVGCAETNYTDAGILLVTIWLRVTDECFAETVLHELTHALGVGAHSPYPEDIMYFQQTCGGPHYSERDLATLRALYEAPPFFPRGN